MREGSIFRRCTRCRRRATSRDRRCPQCGNDRLTWGYMVDLAPAGAPRDQRVRSGFETKAKALDDMHRAQTEKADGIYVEPTKVTLGAYLGAWIANDCGGVRVNTLKGYEAVCRIHITPRLGHVPIQKLTRPQIKALYEELRTSGYTPKVRPAQRKLLEDVAGRYQVLAAIGDERVADTHRERGRRGRDSEAAGCVTSRPAARW